MEKLREHERDMTSPKDSSRIMTTKSMQEINKSAKPTSNRFNKVAENILTKIRYRVFYLVFFTYLDIFD